MQHLKIILVGLGVLFASLLLYLAGMAIVAFLPSWVFICLVVLIFAYAIGSIWTA